MAILTILGQTTTDYGTNFAFKECLKTAGWTVAGSGDDTTAGLDGIDRLTSSGEFNVPGNWIVLNSPHASPTDRIQILQEVYLSTYPANRIRYNPEADYVGGNVSVLPTSSYESIGYTYGPSVSGSYHFLYDTSPPYGCAFFSVARYSTTENQSTFAGIIPITGSAAPIGKSYAVYTGIYSSGILVQRRPLKRPESTTALKIYDHAYNAGGLIAPGKLKFDINGSDISLPTMFTSENFGYYHGVSNFLQTNGNERPLYTLFNNKTRICLGDYNLPWDGTTIPVP